MDIKLNNIAVILKDYSSLSDNNAKLGLLDLDNSISYRVKIIFATTSKMPLNFLNLPPIIPKMPLFSLIMPPYRF